MPAVERVIAWLVYASVALGALFVAVASQLQGFPSFLRDSIAGGEVLYALCAVAIARRVRWAPYFALVLAVVTLAVSLPQPAHYEFAESGQLLAFAIFLLGLVLQGGIIVAVAATVLKSRKR